MKKLYSYKTSAGTFYIVQRNGRFFAMFDGETYGNYHKPETVAEELAAGHTFSVGTDTAQLGIPDELSDWERLF